MEKTSTIQALIPEKYRVFFSSVMKQSSKIQEIRIRQNGPVYIKGAEGCFYVDESGNQKTTSENALYLNQGKLEFYVDYLCGHSVYAYADEMKQGYLTLEGGHRVGIIGQTVMENGMILSVKNVNAINIRIAHEIKGCANKVLPFLYHDNQLKSTLIVSAPGCGKTTMLRDLVRQISNGTRFDLPRNICIVDERSEVAGSYLGIAQNDVGIHTDILDGCPKAIGISLLLRSMAPDVIAVDELGGERDYEAVENAYYAGCKMIATIHGNCYEQIRHNPNVDKMFRYAMFERVVILSNTSAPGSVMEILDETGRTICSK